MVPVSSVRTRVGDVSIIVTSMSVNSVSVRNDLREKTSHNVRPGKKRVYSMVVSGSPKRWDR